MPTRPTTNTRNTFDPSMIRTASFDDLPGILRLLDAAFAPSTYESRLVSLIPAAEFEGHAWIDERDGVPVAFVLYTPALRDGEAIGFHLAPLAVAPGFQGEGIGSELLRHTLALEPVGSTAVFVLGDPDYYGRFGFAPLVNPTCSYDESNRHFRALRWEEPVAPFVIGYHEAFRRAEEDPGELT